MRAGLFAQLRRFLGVGALNALVGLLVIYAAKWFFAADDVIANAIGYAVGMSMSFVLNSRWTFDFRGAQWPAFARFVGVSLVAYGANLATVLTALHLLGLNAYLAQALGIPAYTLTLFFASRHLVFRVAPAAGEKGAT